MNSRLNAFCSIAVLTQLIACQAVADERTDSDCTPSATHTLSPEIAAASGRYPLWLMQDVSGAAGISRKAYWVIARDQPGDLVVTGRRLDAEGTARFRVSATGLARDSLLVRSASRSDFRPKGARSDTLAVYSFQPAYLVFDAPGCWEINARLGGSEVRIVQRVIAQSRSPSAAAAVRVESIQGDSP